MGVTGHCESEIAWKLEDGKYLHYHCTLPRNHEREHQAVMYWPVEIEDNPDSLTDQELPYDCPHRDYDGAPCGYPVGKAGVCKRGHRSG